MQRSPLWLSGRSSVVFLGASGAAYDVLVDALDDPVDVAVVGAGFGGLALASFCGDADLRVTVLERRPELAPEGVGLVLQPNGLQVLGELGVLDEMLGVGHRTDVAQLRDPSGRLRAQSTYGQLEHPHPYLLVIERTVAVSVLAARLPPAVEMRFGHHVTGLLANDDGVCGVRFNDADGAERTIRARCVVGANGANSTVRKAMRARLRWRTGPSPNLIALARRRPAVDAAVLYCGPGWCDGVLPLGDRTYFFDHITAENRDVVQRRDFNAWKRIYARRVPEGAELVADLESFDDVAFLSGRTHQARPRVRSGVALVGDAAAAVHPHHGQGANLALEDARALGHALADDASSASLLDQYARVRDARARRAVPWSLFIGCTLDAPHAGWRAVRTASYLASHIPAVSRDTTRRQAGLA